MQHIKRSKSHSTWSASAELPVLPVLVQWDSFCWLVPVCFNIKHMKGKKLSSKETFCQNNELLMDPKTKLNLDMCLFNYFPFVLCSCIVYLFYSFKTLSFFFFK